MSDLRSITTCAGIGLVTIEPQVRCGNEGKLFRLDNAYLWISKGLFESRWYEKEAFKSVFKREIEKRNK